MELNFNVSTINELRKTLTFPERAFLHVLGIVLTYRKVIERAKIDAGNTVIVTFVGTNKRAYDCQYRFCDFEGMSQFASMLEATFPPLVVIRSSFRQMYQDEC